MSHTEVKKRYAAPRYKAFLENLGGIGSFAVVKEVTEDLGALSNNLVTSFNDTSSPFDTFLTQGNDVNVAENETTGDAGFAGDQFTSYEVGDVVHIEFDFRIESGSGSLFLYISAGAVDTEKSNIIEITSDGHYEETFIITDAGSWTLGNETSEVWRFNISNITLKKSVLTTYKAFKWLSVNELKALLGI